MTLFNLELKNDLLDFSYDDEVEEDKEEENVNIDTAREIIDKLVSFGLDYKRKAKKTKVVL